MQIVEEATVLPQVIEPTPLATELDEEEEITCPPMMEEGNIIDDPLLHKRYRMFEEEIICPSVMEEGEPYFIEDPSPTQEIQDVLGELETEGED